jgi:hypothetical protein
LIAAGGICSCWGRDLFVIEPGGIFRNRGGRIGSVLDRGGRDLFLIGAAGISW